MGTVVHIELMENDSQKTSATLLIVPGILVIELESAPTQPDAARSATLEIAAPLALALEVHDGIPSYVEGAGSSRYVEKTLASGGALPT